MISGCQGYDRVYDIVLYHQSESIEKIIKTLYLRYKRFEP